MTVIRLDWDNICWKAMESRVENIKKFKFVKEIDVKESCKLGGYHIRAKTFWKLTDNALWNLRYELLDDSKRLVRDTIGIGEDLLFAFKKDKKRRTDRTVYASFLWQSTDLFKLIRNLPESEWHLMRTSKNSRIYIPKQFQRLQELSQSRLTSYAVEK